MDINATTLNSNMILVTWTGFPLIDHNGILTEYEIQYNQTVAVDSHPPSATERVPANTTEVILTGLGANVDYNVTVRARTVVGPGPYNPQFATAQTDQDGT